MTPISKTEEQIAHHDALTGVSVQRQRLFTSRGWTYRIVDVADLPREEATP